MAKSLTYEFWFHVKNNIQLSTNTDRAMGGKFWMGVPVQFTILPIERTINMRFGGQENSDTMRELDSAFSGQMYMVLQSQVSDPFFYNQIYFNMYLFFCSSKDTKWTS